MIVYVLKGKIILNSFFHFFFLGEFQEVQKPFIWIRWANFITFGCEAVKVKLPNESYSKLSMDSRYWIGSLL